ncbi:hypothetical protein PHLCEN_2v6452 [Hermanssonia centrifuga]|uniref:Tyr recombinase domain-containing protein n=1 Tax=Hermanssonia centrifuga TaxID=98765 RepID=A0A2R6NZ82_9APHY|nr:hypothetical protein PHLCEN_2v6452 [Hermanssonia centrifuga]
MPATAFQIQVAPHAPTSVATVTLPPLHILPSDLRPRCRAEERIFQWRGVNSPPPSVLPIPIIQRMASLASHASLSDTTAYGSGLRKFHLFCDIFSVSESDRLPAPFAVLHSFAIWAAADPDINDPTMAGTTPFEPVAVSTVRKYLSAVRAWHIAQGWPAPLSADDHSRINWSLRGLDRMQQGRRSKLPRPPITLPMLAALRRTLDISNPFDACIWAMACCSFWGMMRFGEVSVKSRNEFNSIRHITRAHVLFGHDLDGWPYARLDLPAAKTARPGETQSVFLSQQGETCPLEALRNLSQVVPAGPQDPLFSWRDRQGDLRPMVRDTAMHRINAVLHAWGWGTSFGHSFRIGGASFFLGQGVAPEVVRIAGRWKSLAYEVYIRAFEQVSSHHLGNLSQRYNL